MTVLYIFGLVVGVAFYLWLGATAGYRLAPSVGYFGPEERDDWRRFGWNWGILGVVVCWLYGRLVSKGPAFAYPAGFSQQMRSREISTDGFPVRSYDVSGPPNVEKLTAKRDLKGLAKALVSDDAAVRQDAARSLERLADRKAVPLIVEHLRDKMDSGAFNDSAGVLCAMGADAAPVLVDRLLNSPGHPVVYAVALGKLGESNGLAPLLEASKSPYSGVRGSAVAGLGAIGTPAATDRLLEVFHNDPNVDIRGGAVLALAGHKLPGAYETFMVSLQSDDRLARRFAAAGLGLLGDVRARERLQQIATNDPDHDVRRSAHAALVDLKAGSGRDVLDPNKG